MKQLLKIFLFLLSAFPAVSQSSNVIYADLEGNDTLQRIAGLFIRELAKSQSGNFLVKPLSEYKGQGIYIANTTVGVQKVKAGSQLLQSGVEAFSINAGGNSVQILGNSNLGVSHGIFSYLHLLGYRYYFPNPDWHITPVKPALYKKYAIVSKPSFDYRRIWYGYGTGSATADSDYNFWVLANKLGGSINASFGHNYENIMLSDKDVFLKHPEWFYPVAPKGVLPDGAKFDMSREDLLDYLIRYTEKEIEKSLKAKTQAYKMISMSPSDGLGTCNSPACQKLGTITDRVYYLVNRVARGIRKKYPSSLIGCLAYGEYISPPTKPVEPNVFVAITTAFNSSKYSIEQLVDEWRKKGAIVGIYDYFSWYAWDYDIPGQSQASKPNVLISSIKKYYAKGVRSYEGESSIGWISKGLGYYLAAQQMWNINADATASRNEFFTLCFGKASRIMQKLWSEWESYTFAAVREKDMAQWMDYANEAERLESSAIVKRRIFQIKSYLHYLFLYHKYKLKSDEENLRALLSFGYRKLDDGSVAGFPSFFELGNRSTIPGMAMGDNAKWKSDSKPVTQEEMDRLIKRDRGLLTLPAAVRAFNYAPRFTTIRNLERFKKLVEDSAQKDDNKFWFTNEWVIEIKKKGTQNYLVFTGDFIGDPSNIKPFKISVYPFTKDGNITSKSPVAYFEYNKSRVPEKLSLATLAPGFYTMVIVDPVKIFKVSFSPEINYSMVMRPDRPIKCTMLNYSFFYVPDDVVRFNVIKAGTVELITPSGRRISMNDKKAEEIQVQVQKGEAGLWRIKPLYDELYLEGIPPYLGTSPKQMLIPAGIQ
jgi:hypothetical protein